MKPKDPSSAEVRQLIESLHPRDCGKGLLRLGEEGDGGYLIPNDLEGIRYCFSAGVGKSIEFEKILYQSQVACYLIDGSISELPRSPNPPYSTQLIFDEKYLGAYDCKTHWTLMQWVSHYANNDLYNRAILKIDIEGSEWEALLSTPSALLEHFRICIIEFHSLDQIFNAFGWPIIRACFQKLNQIFQVVHLHPNNCCPVHVRNDIEIPELMEFTFYNRYRIMQQVEYAPYTQTFPNPLDRHNIPHKPAVFLPRCWYHTAD